ncbi:HAD domain-containing protein [Niveibacterium sp. COAC-50]|uniref:HAD domain-containing protein n=1 Tax=Niveibacterium sp. COAC-50 TaxID=2729384 RepID=UPI00155209B6|nr:HAD domain-containing protein [Niveibacterium sp. COAC-50]
MILFLDFDGVLHPGEVYLRNGTPELDEQGELFMWAPILEEILADFPAVRVVLSTTWVVHLGFERTRKHLPATLQRRVIGATWHTAMNRTVFAQLSRYQQIAGYIERAGLERWLAIDDDAWGWPPRLDHKLIATVPARGLGHPVAQQRLREALAREFR